LKEVAALRPSDLSSEPAPIWKRRWFQNTAMVLVAIIGVYAIVYRDVVSRARESYENAERYMAWNADPESKKKYFTDRFEADKAALTAEQVKTRMSDREYRRRLDALEFDRDFALSESSLKYAYQWYKDTYDLFSPPESKWVREARKKAPQVLEQWKQELRAQKIPFEDTMFE
jgi:hypothetical protein